MTNPVHIKEETFCDLLVEKKLEFYSSNPMRTLSNSYIDSKLSNSRMMVLGELGTEKNQNKAKLSKYIYM